MRKESKEIEKKKDDSKELISVLEKVPKERKAEVLELLAREICKAEKIAFTPNKNYKVDYLYEINHKLNICDSDLDFAIALFAKSIKTRYNWLKEKVERNKNKEKVSLEEQEVLLKMLKSLEGYK